MKGFRSSRESGQTIVMLALVLGILMIIAALVIDVGSTHRVRTETQYVCDAGALAGIAELMVTQDPSLARAKAMEVIRRNGYAVGTDGITSIEAASFNHLKWPYEPPAAGGGMNPANLDVPNSDRYIVNIHRELPQYFASIIGIRRTGTLQSAVAAILGAVPIDADLGSRVGFPDRANLAQFGPAAPYTFGDPYSTQRLDNGAPNPTYNPDGYTYDIVVPADLLASTGSSFVRLEIFDPDTINRGNHVAKQPSRMQDTNGDPTEPETGGIDEIRAPPPDGNADTNAAQFPTRSTETEFTLRDSHGQVIATARYGPTENTPFWLHREAPASNAPHVATHADPAQAQIATDIKWVTPQGFEFDTATYPGPYRVNVRTVSGSSENGYSLRISIQRPNGQAYNPATHGVTDSSALAIYGRGKVPINFSTSDVTKIPIGNVPSGAEQVVVTNFDTDVGSQSVVYTMSSFDTTTGQGEYPVLFPAPANASGANVVTDTNGNKYFTSQNGQLSPNGQFRTDSYDIPQTVAVPQTDGSGNLVFDGNGRITVMDTRDFEGGELEITYTAGAHDTSIWEVSFSGPPTPGLQQIVLIR
ncbi:MAG: Tad domain-containing protein [Armatimonadetes bacterium]|nr:Tad domain-containing protein [Armatimonadota bacterium]